MAYEQSSILGSGTSQAVNPIRQTVGKRGSRRGQQVIIINPEDLNSAAGFRTMQVSVGTSSAVELPPAASGHRPFRKEIKVYNHDASNPVFIAHTSDNTIARGVRIAAGLSESFPMLSGIQLWGIATGSTVTVSLREI